MTREETEQMFSRNGLWIIGDHRMPGTTMPVLVLSDVAQNGIRLRGRAFMWTNSENNELTPDADVWHGTQTFLAGGPFSTKSCQDLDEERRELQALRQTVQDLRDDLRLLRDSSISAGCLSVSQCAQSMLDNIHDRTTEYEFKNKLQSLP